MLNINDMLQTYYEQGLTAFKKPVLVKIEGPIEEEQVISSLENAKQLARVGDYVVTGVEGEQYPISPEVFTEYEISKTKENHYYKKKRFVKAYEVDFEGTIETPQGAILNFQPGYFIVMQSPTDAWTVEGNIFRATYEIVE